MLWGSEVKIEQSALLERLEIQEKYRGWGIGTWFFDEVWKSDLDHGVPKVSFPQPIPDEIVSSTDTTIGLVPVRAARANLRPRAAPADWAAEHLRLGARRLSATREDESAPLLPTSEIEPRQARLQAKLNVLCAQAGFRKVCGTDFLCLARDPEHPSRLYSAEADVRA